MNGTGVYRRIELDDDHALIIGYQEDQPLRHSFDDLARTVFGLSFEGWYQSGHWRDNYVPYSILFRDQIIANVSVSPMDFSLDGQLLRLIQLGTVMTRPDQRGRGWIRRLMEMVDKDWAEHCDGAFLYANDGVTGLYPKFGYQPAEEQECRLEASGAGEGRAERVDLADPSVQLRFEAAVRASNPSSRLELMDPAPLLFFYLDLFMADCVYHLPELDCWAVAQREGQELLLHQVFSAAPVDLKAVIQALGGGDPVRLGFAPLDASGFQVRPIREPDSTMFVKGAWANALVQEHLRIPSLAHT